MKHIIKALKVWTVACAVLIVIPLSQMLWDGISVIQAYLLKPEAVASYKAQKGSQGLTEGLEGIPTDKLEAKIAELKSDILSQLAECETGGVSEPNGYMRLDSNDMTSWGRYQWQRKSVQHWVKELYDKEVNLQESALIAWDIHPDIPLDAFTWDVLMLKVGPDEWFNCNRKLGLGKQVALVKHLME